MKNIVKIFSLLSIAAVIPGAFAATSRVSMVTKASPRLPSIAGYISSKNATTNSGGTSYLADIDCLNNYTDCIKGNDACGSEFEECTNNILLHAKMPICLNVLSQCSSKGVSNLFGTSSLSAITTATTDSTGEITGYTYPKSDSALGQMVTAAQIANQLNKDQCVKKYTTCLKKDAVCGADFELCTDNKEFKKQALACESTLARCKNDGKEELFGKASLAASLDPDKSSRLGEMIAEGRDLAVNNAVATCNKVTDQCILNACSKNPNKCIENRAELLIRIADSTNGGKAVTTQDLMEISKLTSSRDITSYIRQECQQTIGSNRYCYMTVEKKPVTKESDLVKPETVEEVFDDMYADRFSALKTKIDQITDNFDAKIQDKCIDTMSSCAMRSCGGGIGSVCYKESRKDDGSVDITQGTKSYNEINAACRAIVDNDANCQYAAVLKNDGLYGTSFGNTTNVFTELFPDDGNSDPIGIVAYLNTLLATSYNDAAIAKLKTQCETVVKSCVNAMCGKNYTKCYRNRNDIIVKETGTYATDNNDFNNSMNKMGGVLDYNIVIGLCMDTVKSASVCDEHLKVAAAEWRDETNKDNISWNSGKTEVNDGQYLNVRSGWLDANSTSVNSTVNTSEDKEVIIACGLSDSVSVSGCAAEHSPAADGSCVGVAEDNGCMYDKPIYQSYSEYVLENSATTLFQTLLRDIERKVQADYNAKLTNEQNVCRSNNIGGIMGKNDTSSTFMWAKLTKSKVPSTYSVKGLQSKDFTETGDLYGAFCRARITVMSDDPIVQRALSETKNETTAYFAVGDSFACGSWLSDKTLDEVTKAVGEQALIDQGVMVRGKNGKLEESSKTKSTVAWSTVAGLLGGGGIGIGLAEGGVLKKWSDSANLKNSDGVKKSSNADLQSECKSNAEKARNELRASKLTSSRIALINSYAAKMESTCKKFANATQADNCEYEALESTSGGGDDVVEVSHPGVHVDEQKFINYVNNKTRTYTFKYSGDTGNWSVDGMTVELEDYGITANVDGNEDAKFTVTYSKSAATETVDKIKVNAMIESIDKMEEVCKEPGNDKLDSDTNLATRITVPIVTAGLGATLAGTIARTAINIKKEEIQSKAAQEWMEEIGDHIKCYLGTEELGSFGDIVGIEIQ